MSEETIVAIYDTPAHAELAAADLRQAGLPDTAISIHAGTRDAAVTGTTAATAPREQGFWSSLFGGAPDHDTAVYDRSVDDGAVLSVRTPDAYVERVLAIVESHHPIDIDERAASFKQGAVALPAAGLQTSQPIAPLPVAASNGQAAPPTRRDDGSMQLSEESLTVGKRLVNRGGTRIRRFVVERPVEENVSLHRENVVLERHPVTDGRPATDSFSERTVEMSEMAEEAIISKTAHVYEEVGLRKEVSDRVETIHDTVRREEVEIETIPGPKDPLATVGSKVPPAAKN